ncbi:MAG: hypothetical protein DMG54_26280 [Acidobacteria bacterium]|nr:MAG: hypothetical protein DMG54_26280 [Acidobacteriota bacterium]PYU70159.1 MAG: hypothetical protein DMG52_26535 [Acidobacteriota bacterium]
MPRVGGSGMDVELQMTCLVYLRAATALGTSKRVPDTGSFPGTLSVQAPQGEEDVKGTATLFLELFLACFGFIP